jgi:hypothetical protein
MTFKPATIFAMLASAAVNGQAAQTGIRPLDAEQFDRAKRYLDAARAWVPAVFVVVD